MQPTAPAVGRHGITTNAEGVSPQHEDHPLRMTEDTWSVFDGVPRRPRSLRENLC